MFQHVKSVFVKDGYMTIWGFSAYLSSFIVCSALGWGIGRVIGRSDSTGAFIGVLVSLVIYYRFYDIAVTQPTPPQTEYPDRIGVDV